MIKSAAVVMAITALSLIYNPLYVVAAETPQQHRSSFYKAQHGDTVAAKAIASMANKTAYDTRNSSAHGAKSAVLPVSAYSDTTSSEADSSIVEAEPSAYTFQMDVDDDSKLTEIIDSLMKHGTIAGIILSIIGTLFLLAICALPFLVVILPVIYLIKRSNNKTRLAEKMIENGTPLPHAEGFSSPTDEALMKMGIRQTAIGVGLCLMGFIMDISVLAAIGALVMAIGIGKIISARVGKKRRDKDKDDSADNIIELK